LLSCCCCRTCNCCCFKELTSWRCWSLQRFFIFNHYFSSIS